MPRNPLSDCPIPEYTQHPPAVQEFGDMNSFRVPKFKKQ
jgi:hypothetical protein